MTMNLFQKLVEIRKSVDYLRKDNKGHQYSYVSSSQVLGALRARMDELGVLLVTKILDTKVTETVVTGKDKFDNEKKTTTYFTELTTEMTWINADNPEETLIIPFYSQGIDTAGEKGVGKALTYNEKNFLLKQFNIATDALDPDSFQEKAEQNRKPASITEEEEKQLQDKINEVANLQNIEPVAVLNALKVKSIKGISLIKYEGFMAQCDKWINTIKKQKAGQAQ